jgi:hypothetical protein
MAYKTMKPIHRKDSLSLPIALENNGDFIINHRTGIMQNRNANDLSHHILPNSATMVGICIMVISIVKSLSPSLINHLIDKALAIDSVMFMSSAVLSFLSIRAEQYSARLERWAEIIFLAGLAVMTFITVIVSFEII